jgi:hypothetical protein
MGENERRSYSIRQHITRRGKDVGTWEIAGENTVRESKSFRCACSVHNKFFTSRISVENTRCERWSVSPNPYNSTTNDVIIKIAAMN